MQAGKHGTGLLLLAMVVVVGVHAAQLPAQPDMSVQASDMCDTCLWLVNTTEIYLNSSDVKLDIINFLNTEVHDLLGDVVFGSSHEGVGF